MNYIALIFFILLIGCNQNLFDKQFEEIKANPEKLANFISEMPKGGELHYHAIGSVYAEDYLEIALNDSFFIDPISYQLYKTKEEALLKKDSNSILINDLVAQNQLYKDSIIDAWSVKDYQKLGRDGHDQFFGTFDKFWPAYRGYEPQHLSKLCKKAAEQNLQYLEAMIWEIDILDSIVPLAIQTKNSIDITKYDTFKKLLDARYNFMINNGMKDWTKAHSDSLNMFYEKTNKHGVELKFLNFAVRVIPHEEIVFAQLLLAFATAEMNDHVVGVNFLAPEDNGVALSNYTKQMQMINFLKEKYPEVNVTLHAGELVLGKGQTKDYDLTYHIDAALKHGKASRIGHGSDILSEENSDEILKKMASNKIPIELNLTSNEVNLGLNPENHPIKAYYEAGVPICISTDDEGVLRTNITKEYIKLFEYLPDLSYSELKQIVYNSITYSFLDEKKKNALIIELDSKFSEFENVFF